MFVAVDIDGTIAGMNSARTVAMYNQQFNLQIARERLFDIPFHDFMKLEEVIAYRNAVGEERFQEEREQIHQHPDLLRVLTTLPYAVEGVTQLSQEGRVRYYTIRKGGENDAIQNATTSWLNIQGFPNPYDVVFCRTFRAKLVHAWREPENQLIIIDDRWQDLLQTFGLMAEDPRCQQFAHDLRERLTLVAFGAHTQPTQTHGLKVTVLPSWENGIENNFMFRLP